MEPSEQTPLVQQADPHELLYRRFSKGRKRYIVALASWSGLMPLFVSGVFTVSIPTIARDFNTSTDIISLSVSLSILGGALGSMTGAAYSSYYGRRPIYLIFFPLFVIGSLGVVFSYTVASLLVFRWLQAFGSAPGMALGGATISDIYKLEERGFAMGVFFSAVLLGPALAPLTGGIAAHYASWRAIQVALAISGLLAWILIFLTFPETSHPGTLGKDKEASKSPSLDSDRGRQRRTVKLINPFKVLWILRSPNLFLVSFAGMTSLVVDFVILIPLAETVGSRYNISNRAILGACFAPIGLGNMIGAPVAGRISDSIIKRYRRKRGGEWYPEDRLRATLFGAGILVPLSGLLIGLFMQFVPGPVGLTLVLICMFFNGLGVDIVLAPSSAYCVDILHDRSAESMAANTGFRSLILAFVSTLIFPGIHTIGVAATNAIAAGLAWIGFILLYLTIRYGKEMREYIDIGYSTAANN